MPSAAAPAAASAGHSLPLAAQPGSDDVLAPSDGGRRTRLSRCVRLSLRQVMPPAWVPPPIGHIGTWPSCGKGPPLKREAPHWPCGLLMPAKCGQHMPVLAHKSPACSKGGCSQIPARDFHRSQPLLAGVSREPGPLESRPASLNPRPPLLAGASWTAARAPRMLRCFNPRRPLLAGESGSRPAVARSAEGFNPRPPLLAGESCPGGGASRPTTCFNPRPPLLAGESCGPAAAGGQCRGFNPRPPLLAGESAAILLAHWSVCVSIHARHCWRANRLT